MERPFQLAGLFIVGIELSSVFQGLLGQEFSGEINLEEKVILYKQPKGCHIGK